MKIWIHLDGIQQGPYTLDEIASMGLAPSTPVWYDGLPQWMPACEADVTAGLFGSRQEAQAGSQTYSQAAGDRPAAAATVQATQVPTCPPTFIGWSVLVLLCCFPIGGILGIIFSSMTRNAYARQDYQRAARLSEYAEWTLILSIVIGLMSMPLTVLFW